MTELLTSAQMRAIEAAAIASGEVTGLELMERAGRGVVEAIFEEWPELRTTSHRAVVLCGPGNNGGDGFVVARMLKEWGWEVGVFLYGEPEKMPPDARVNYERWLRMGEVSELCEDDYRWRLSEAALYIDALFGSGLTRAPEGAALDVICRIEGGHGDGGYFRPRTVSIDAPSGLCLNSGRCLFHSLTNYFAALTVTFDSPKLGHYLAEGPLRCGKVVVADIGLAKVRRYDPKLRKGGAWPYGNFPIQASLLVPRPQLEGGVIAVPFLDKWRHVYGQQPHKYNHGDALILSGPSGRGGAARLSARGALRIGAGVVTVGCPGEALAEHAARLDAIMLREVGEGADLTAALEDRRINALCLGPGLGLDARAEGLVAAALGIFAGGPLPPSPPRGGEGTLAPSGVAPGGPPTPSLPHEGGGRHPEPDVASRGTTDQPAPPLPLVGRGWGRGASDKKRAVVLDADALTILSRRPDLFAALHDGCVLTPHAGEFARLFPDIAEKHAAPATKGPAYSKVDATREAAARAGCVVLFKGPDTVIADPSGRCSINSAAYERAAPWLATAGSGDVLAGFIAGLLARGFGPMQAAETGAWLHVECARSFGPGLIAEDLPEELPKVFRALGL